VKRRPVDAAAAQGVLASLRLWSLGEFGAGQACTPGQRLACAQGLSRPVDWHLMVLSSAALATCSSCDGSHTTCCTQSPWPASVTSALSALPCTPRQAGLRGPGGGACARCGGGGARAHGRAARRARRRRPCRSRPWRASCRCDSTPASSPACRGRPLAAPMNERWFGSQQRGARTRRLWPTSSLVL